MFGFVKKISKVKGVQVPTEVINLGLGPQGVGQPSTKLFKSVLTENAEWPVLEVKYHTKASRK